MKKLISHDFANVTAIKKRVKGGQSVFIEGFANRFSSNGQKLIDRGRDLILPDAWKLENFMNNPIIFFNHDRDKPIGKAIKAEITEDGLKIKVKLSDSEDAEISRVRDLVSEGILKSFSVGFDPGKIDTEVIEGKEISIIKEAELLEVSVVSIPMAEHSLFNVTAKSLSDMSYEQAKRLCLLGKGEGEDEETEDEDQGKLEINSQPGEAESSSATIDAIRQTNVLLAQLITEHQKLGQKLEQAFKPVAEDEETEVEDTEDDEPKEGEGEETEDEETEDEEMPKTEDEETEETEDEDTPKAEDEETEDEDEDEDEPKGFDPKQVKTLAEYLSRAEAILKSNGL